MKKKYVYELTFLEIWSLRILRSKKMVDSIKNSLNRYDVQPTRVNDIDTKSGANSSSISKGLASDKYFY